MEGFLTHRFGELILGGAYFRNFTVSLLFFFFAFYLLYNIIFVL